MKIRTGFVSNSSTASFVVKTRPTTSDRHMARCYDGEDGEKKEHELFILAPEKIGRLKKMGFVPTKHDNPFRVELNYPEYNNKNLKSENIDDTFLKYSITCNHRQILEFLVANDIPFRAAIHYGNLLYSYEAGANFVYILRNFGIEYIRRPEQLEEEIEEGKKQLEKNKKLPEEKQLYIENMKPFEKINKTEFLKHYDEEIEEIGVIL